MRKPRNDIYFRKYLHIHFYLSTKLAFHIIMVKVYQMHCLILIQLFGIVVQVDMNLKR